MSITQSYNFVAHDLRMRHSDFAQRFKRLCEEAGLPATQNELGKELNVSGTFIWHVRNGEKLPKMETAVEWAKKLDVCTEYLLTGRGPKHPENGKKKEGKAAREVIDITELSSDERRYIQKTISALKESPDTPKAG